MQLQNETTDKLDRADLRGAAYKILLFLESQIGRPPSYSEIARKTGYSHVTVWRAIKDLEAAGFIAVDRGGRINDYQIVK